MLVSEKDPTPMVDTRRGHDPGKSMPARTCVRATQFAGTYYYIAETHFHMLMPANGTSPGFHPYKSKRSNGRLCRLPWSAGVGCLPGLGEQV